MALADYELMIDWDADDVWDEANEDVSAVCEYPLTYERGWENILRQGQASTLEFKLFDPDAAYSPENQSSPIYPNAVSGKPVRLRAYHDSTWYPLWKGKIQKIVPHPWFDEKYTYFYCIDGMNYLAGASITTELYIQKTENYILNDILDQAGWPAGAAHRAIDAYVDTEYGSIEYGLWWHKRKALDAIHEFESITQGKFFISEEGKAVWHDRAHRANNAAVQYVFDNVMTKDLKYEHSLDLVFNEVVADVQSPQYTGPYAESLVALWPVSGTLYVGDDVSYHVQVPTNGVKGFLLRGVVKTAPTDADIIIDVDYDGASIFTDDAHRLTIAAGEYTGITQRIDVKEYEEGKILKLNVKQVGATVYGSWLAVQLLCKKPL